MGRSIITRLVILQLIGLGVIAVASIASAIDHDRPSAGLMHLEARDASQDGETAPVATGTPNGDKIQVIKIQRE